MSLFLIPATLIVEIERMLNGFWWGGSGGRNKGIRWLAWEKLCMAKEHGGLGFRNLRAFNLALLGKQAWRLLSQPDLLVSKLYKAKYFPHSDIIQASKRSNGSFVWNNILEAQKVLKEGAVWCIGDGRSIPLFDDKWTTGRCLVKPRQQGLFNPLLRVDYLLRNDRKAWNESLVRFLLDDVSATAVLKTPLIPCVSTDLVGWKGEKDGSYSVRSAYRLVMQNIMNFSHFRVDGNWGMLWKLQVPPKVKIFLWRLCRNCVPTRSVLARRGVPIVTVCPWCNDHEETPLHLFFQCSTAQACWTTIGVAETIATVVVSDSPSTSRLFFDILTALSGNERVAWCMSLWSLWSSRNNLVWNHVRDTVAAIVLKGGQLLLEWTVARMQPTGAAVLQQVAAARRHPVQWTKPLVGFVKCNVDAAFDKEGNKVGFGMCLRDANGAFVAAKMQTFSPIIEVYKGEALGLLLAMEWVRDLGYKDVIFELDAKVVVDDFNKHYPIFLDYGCILDSCKDVFTFFTNNSHVEFSRREANKVAHTLAGVALFTAHSHTLFDVPACISATITNEMK